jgi:hypothetical protein
MVERAPKIQGKIPDTADLQRDPEWTEEVIPARTRATTDDIVIQPRGVRNLPMQVVIKESDQFTIDADCGR